MKRIIFILLLFMSISPAFAQGSKVGKALLSATVERQVVKSTLPVFQLVKITNLPGEPMIKLGGAVDNAPAVLSARMLPGADSYYIIRPSTPNGMYTDQIFLPRNILENRESFYRGMRLGKIDDLKNLLINGLEISKSHYYPGKIYASPKPFIPLWHATMGMEPILLTLIQIPANPTLCIYEENKIDEVFFRRDIPVEFISNVWVFLEVNKKPDWYKVVLENNELVFIHAPGEMRPWSDGLK